ncbi:MAG: RNA-binding protein [Rhodobacteraceae bacterium]|nr:RNA-binding protein [Paracoccaceae bacterium]
MTRGGRKKTGDDPQRRCIATGAVQPKAGLVRFVVDPGGTIVPDIAGKLPGRGIWVAADRAALERAVAKKLFARAARQSVSVPPDLVAATEDLLLRQVTGLLALARKGGKAIAGYEKVREAAVAGSVAVLLQARDGSVAQMARIRPPKGENAHITCLFAAELGLAFGRENVIHAALAAGGLCERIVEEATRLAGVRDGCVPGGADPSGPGPEQIGVEDS